MASSKETQMRVPQGADQHRHLFNSTQNYETSSQQQSQASANKQKTQNDEGPIQLLAKNMDSSGNPVPDVDASQTAKNIDDFDDIDPYDAMHADFD